MSEDEEDSRDDSALVNRLICSPDAAERAQGIALVEVNAKQGDPYAKYTLAKWYRVGFEEYPVNPVRESELLWAAAEGLVPDAVHDIGAKIQNDRDSLPFFIVAGVMGDLSAMRTIHQCLIEGLGGVDKNLDAARILEKYIDEKVIPYRKEMGMEASE